MSCQTYALDYEPEVLDQIRGLPRELQQDVARFIARLTDDPQPIGFEKLEDGLGVRVIWRGVRITYWVDGANCWVHIARVALEPS